jgi:hypothetical protein
MGTTVRRRWSTRELVDLSVCGKTARSERDCIETTIRRARDDCYAVVAYTGDERESVAAGAGKSPTESLRTALIARRPDLENLPKHDSRARTQSRWIGYAGYLIGNSEMRWNQKQIVTCLNFVPRTQRGIEKPYIFVSTLFSWIVIDRVSYFLANTWIFFRTDKLFRKIFNHISVTPNRTFQTSVRDADNLILSIAQHLSLKTDLKTSWDRKIPLVIIWFTSYVNAMVNCR